MKTKLLGLLIFLLIQYNVLGQAAASFNYDTQTGSLGTTYSWIDCTNGTVILNTGDDVQTNVSWPFNFSFYDNNYTTSNVMSLASNGFIRLDGTANGSDYNGASNYNLTANATNFGQIIALAMYDGNLSDNGSWARSLLTGTAPNRIFTIEYNNLEISYSDNRYADVQISFYESTNKIVLKLGVENLTRAGVDMGLHSGVNGFFNKWKEVSSNSNNTWIEYTPPYVEVNATTGTTTANYSTLKDAFDKINDGTHRGALTVKIKHNTTEGASAVLNASGTGSSNYSSAIIYPTLSGISVAGDLSSPLIDLNGADFVTIDGRVNATGSTKDLNIINSSTSNTSGTSTIRLINGATNNTIKYNTIKGSETDLASGIVFFSTSTVSGNSSNTIDNNNITNATNANRPINAIFSSGTAGRENSTNIISDNFIYDFLKHSTSSNGISLSANTTDFNIIANSFYETTSFVPTAVVSYNAIIINNTTGNNFIVSNNFIGGNTALGNGTWTKTSGSNNLFNAISLNVGTTVNSTIQNNIIRNFTWSNSGNAAWRGIEVLAGNVNIGTTTGNTIGATTGTGSITVTGTTTGQIVTGIQIASIGIVDCQKNTIGSITANNGATLASSIYGINKTATTGTTTISNNNIGSTTSANSINASSTSTANAQVVYGIYNAGTGTIVISNNTISKLNNGTTNTVVGTLGIVNGITSIAGTNTVSNNSIYDLSISNANTNALNNASVSGISLTGTTNTKIVSGNTIYNLTNTNATFAGNVIGLYFAGSTGVNSVSENFIYNLFVTGASTTAASIYGIRTASGATTYSNNIINLGGNSATTIFGIFETGAASNTSNLYFNTIYIDGNPSLGTTNKSYCLWSNASTNVRDFRNNIFMNARSTNGGASLHYAAYFNYTVSTNLTLDYNDYFVSGTAGVLGWWNAANKTALPIVTTKDSASLAINPNFATPGGTVFSNYYITAALSGISGTGILTDYEGITLSATPKMGALSFTLGYIWQGNTSTNFATNTNWVNGVVPPNGVDISFAATPLNHCNLDQNRTLQNITNTSTKQFVVNGKQLTLTGSFISSTANQVDATAALSTIVFGGTTAQNIPNGAFVSNTIDGLTVNNSNGLSQNGAITIQSLLTLTNGAFTIGSNSLTLNGLVSTTSGSLIGGSSSNISIGGSGASTTLPAIVLNNLTLNRTNGISLGGAVSVAGTLQLTSGTLTVGANMLTISGNTPTRTSGNINSSNSGASLVFTNSTAITLPTSIFTGNLNNLTINGAGITVNNNLTINGVLNLQSANPSAIKGTLDIGSSTLDMGASATTIGLGDVNGIIRRTTILPNIEYTFGNQFTGVTFPNIGTLPTQISLKIVIGTLPSWKSDGVKRIYDINQVGGSGTKAVVKVHYLDSELNGLVENDLSLFSYVIPSSTLIDRGLTQLNTSDNWITFSNADFGNLVSAFGIIEHGIGVSTSDIITWDGSFNTDWYDAANWTPSYVPSSTWNVVIPDGATTPNDPIITLSTSSTIKTLAIRTGGILNAGTNSQLTLVGSAGAWINNGVFDASTGKVIFNHNNTSNVVSISGITDFYNIEVGATTTLQPVVGNVLRIAGVLNNLNVVDFASTNNTVEWNGDNQTIINPNGIAGNSGYHNLLLSGSGIKTMPISPFNIKGNFYTNGTVSVTAQSSLTIGGEFKNLSGSTFATGNFNHSISGNFDNLGTFTPSAGTTITLNGTGIQNVYGNNTNFEKLTLNNSAGFNLYTNITVNNDLTLTSGNLNVGSTTLALNGGVVKTAGFINVIATSSLTFGGATALTLPSTLFLTTPSINNLTINRTGGVIAGSNFTVNGILSMLSDNPTATIGGFDTASYTLNMGATATTTGIGEVTGVIRRTTILPNVEYTFGNQFTGVIFPNIGTLPTEISLKVTVGVLPSWKSDGVKRIYDIKQIGGSGTKAVVKVHYLDSELNGLVENDLSLYSYVIPSTTLLDRGLTQLDTADNWITFSNADFGNLTAAFGIIEHGIGVSTSDIITWDGSFNSDWYDLANWTPSFAPGITKNVVIPDATTTPNDPIITASTSSTIKTLAIRTGGILNAGANSILEIGGSGGAWINNGTFNASTGKVIFDSVTVGAVVSISGETNFYNIEVGSDTTLQPLAGTIVRIAGTGTTNPTSAVDFSTVSNTVEWNGANQTIVNPIGIGSVSGYFNLILSGNGTKTMPNTPMSIEGNFTTSGTISATANQVLIVKGNTTIGNGSTLNTGNFNHIIKGNFINNGTFIESSGGIITFNGTTAQSISGTSTTDFEKLTIDNLLNVTLNSNANINNILDLSNGNLIVGNVTLGINGTISNPSGAIDVSPVSNLYFGGTSALTINDNLFKTQPSLNNLTINRSGGVTLGNQNMSVGGTLALPSGTLTLMSNTLTLSGSSPTRVSGNIEASNANAQMAFANSVAITLPMSLFVGNVANFKVDGTGGVISNGDLSVTGILNLASSNPSSSKGSLDMDSSSELNMGALATTVGNGDVTGIVKREHVFADGIEYTFGNQFTSLNFLNVTNGIKPTWVKCKIKLGTAPTWRSQAIQRYYSFAQSGGTDRMITKLHYLDSELHGGETDESSLVYWDAYDPNFTVNNFTDFYPRNHNDTNSVNNWIQLTGPAINYIATSDQLDVKQWGLSYSNVSVHTWTGNGSPNYDGDWSLPGNWNGGVPDENDAILIPDPLTLPIDNNGDYNPYRNLLPTIAPAKAKSVEIAAGATLGATNTIMSVVTNYDITVYGDNNAWVNNGTFLPGTAKVTFANGVPSNAVTIAGTTNFYDITVNDKTMIQPTTSSIIRIENAINIVPNGSILDFTTNNNTIEYNGAIQSVILPNGGTTGYYNLALSGNGVKTFPPSSFQIIGNLSLSESAIATTAADLTVGNNLNISDTSIFNVGAANKMTVSGNIVNNEGVGNLVLQSDINGTASLIHNTNGVLATVQRYISGNAEDWHFLSSPISNQGFTGSWTPSGTYGNNQGYDLYIWDEPTPCWVFKLNTTGTPNWPTIHASTSFVPGRGYLYSVQAASPTNSFEGSLNNGTINYPLTADSTVDPLLKGFNLIGNPYPSSIDWKAATGWTRSNLLDSGGGYDMWIWNSAANNYGVYNSFTNIGTNSVSQYIAPMQGFFVRAESNATISMTNNIRLHTGANNWLRLGNKISNLKAIKVQIASDSGLGFDEAVLQFGYVSNKSGAAKLFSTSKTAPSAYFNIGKEELSVRYLTNTINNPIVPLTFKAGKEGNYTLNLGLDYLGFEYIQLEDKKTKTIHNLLENPSYKFKASEKDDVNRFMIHFAPIDSLTEEDLPALIYYKSNEIVVDLTKVNEQTQVMIYDILGKLISTKNVSGNNIHYFPISKTTQILIVVVKSNNKIIKSKILVE